MSFVLWKYKKDRNIRSRCHMILASIMHSARPRNRFNQSTDQNGPILVMNCKVHCLSNLDIFFALKLQLSDDQREVKCGRG